MDHASLPDERLAELFSQGDAVAFETLVARYLRPLFNFAYRLLGDYDLAEEVAQDSLVRLYSILPKRQSALPLRPLIYRIARNRAIDLLRERKAVPFSALAARAEADESPVEAVPDTEPLPEDILERRDLQKLLAEAIAALPPRYRAVVALRYTTDLTFAEIAESLEVPENTAKTLFQRGKAMLRTALKSRV